MGIRRTELGPVWRRCAILSVALVGIVYAITAGPLSINTVSFGQETPETEPVPAAEKQAVPGDADVEDAAAGQPPAVAGEPAAADAAKVRKKFKTPQRLDEYIVAGGPLMFPIGLCSFLVIVVTLERMVVLRHRRVVPRDFVTRFVQQLEQGKLDRETALRLCEENGSPVAQVFEHAVRKWGRPSVELEQAVIDGGERQISQLRRWLRTLKLVETLGPLLGLLGTVIGMIQTFYEIARSEGAAKASDFAAGIGVAMITTAGGLLVAIPAVTVYMYFIGKVDALVADMDSAAQKVVNLISAEALTAPPSPPARPPRGKTESEEPGEPPREPVKERRRVMG